MCHKSLWCEFRSAPFSVDGSSFGKKVDEDFSQCQYLFGDCYLLLRLDPGVTQECPQTRKVLLFHVAVVVLFPCSRSGKSDAHKQAESIKNIVDELASVIWSQFPKLYTPIASSFSSWLHVLCIVPGSHITLVTPIQYTRQSY